MADRILILAHAGAPSRFHDDRRYIAQAEAFLTLRSDHLPRLGISTHTNDAHDDFQASEPSHVAEPLDSTMFLEDTQLAYAALESHLYDTFEFVSLDERSSSNDEKATFVSAPENICHHSEGDHPSHSSNLKSKFLERNENERREDLPLDQGNNASSKFIDYPVLPDDLSLSHPEVGSRKRQYNEIHAATNAVEISTTGNQVDLTNPPADFCGGTISGSGRQELQPARAEPPPARGEPSDILRLAQLSTTIHPPAPATSIEVFTTHVTPALRELAERSAVAHCFVPQGMGRALDPLERGHWLIPDPARWAVALQIDFWAFLEGFVQGGAAGWGVWCTRAQGDEIPRDDSSSGSGPARRHPHHYTGAEAAMDAAAAPPPSSLGPIKVYCWGEIVKHVYLLLYVASHAKVRKLGLRWIDASGVAVVTMRGA